MKSGIDDFLNKIQIRRVELKLLKKRLHVNESDSEVSENEKNNLENAIETKQQVYDSLVDKLNILINGFPELVDRDLLTYCYVDGYNFDEIACLIGLSVKQVRHRHDIDMWILNSIPDYVLETIDIS